MEEELVKLRAWASQAAPIIEALREVEELRRAWKQAPDHEKRERFAALILKEISIVSIPLPPKGTP